MYGLSSRGMGGVEVLPTVMLPIGISTGTPYHCEYTMNWLVNPRCWQYSPSTWASMIAGNLAAPPAPTGAALTTPPASGADAAALAQSLANQQLVAQNAIDAAQVQSSGLDVASSAIVDTADAAAAAAKAAADSLLNPGGLSLMVWLALGLGVFGIVAFGGGSARRYGR